MSKELVYFPESDIDRKEHTKRVYSIFKEHLTKNGLRLTEQRQRILDFLLKADHHLDQQEIYQALKPHGVGRVTVFRTLKMLAACNIVDHVAGSAGIPKFEVNRGRPHHDHLICISCGKIQEIRWPKLEEIQEAGCRKVGFEPKWHRHEIFGLCRACAKKSG